MRARVQTLAAWPAPPAPPSSSVRARLSSVEAIDDADILEVVPATPRRRPPDVMTVLREDIGDLEQLGTSWQVAALCAAALGKATAARAVFVHAHELRARTSRVIGVFGTKAHNLLGGVQAIDDDFVASSLVSRGEPMTMRFEGALPRLAAARLRVVGASCSLVAVPLMSSGACVGMLEVVDAVDAVEASAANASRSLDACRYVAEQLARFLAARAAAA